MSGIVHSEDALANTLDLKNHQFQIGSTNEMSLSDTSVITSPLVSLPLASRNGPEMGPPLTVAEMEERIRADENLPLKRRQELISALHTLGRALGLDVRKIPAHPGYINDNLEGFSPAALGISEGRWRNTLSLVRSALTLVGLGEVKRRYREPICPAWSKLLALWDSKKRYGLYGVARFLTREGISPDEVDDAVLARYRQHLEKTAIGKNIRELHRTTCVVWNKAVDSLPTWPQRKLTVPNYYNRYALGRDAFPPSFIADLEAYIAYLKRGGDPFDDEGDSFDPLRPISARTRQREILEIASALVHQGRDAVTLKGLKDLVPLEVAKLAAHFFLKRTPEKTNQAAHMLYVLRCIAKYWVKVPAADVKALSNVLKKIQPKKQKGLTKKNRETLHQLDVPAGLAAFLNLPNTMMEKAEESRTPYQRALRVQIAVAFEILLHMPARRKNIAEIEIGKHLLPAGDTYRLTFESEEVKNENLLDSGLLPPKSAALIRLYIKEHRPLLMEKQPLSRHLFPGTKRAGKSIDAFGVQMAAAAKKYAGLRITVHQFRHAAGKLYLDRNPGDYGTVQRFLGHKDIETTIKIYTGAEEEAAFENHYQNILDLRAENPPPAKRRRKQRSRAPLH